jgi:predicted DNA repair protein MutK
MLAFEFRQKFGQPTFDAYSEAMDRVFSEGKVVGIVMHTVDLGMPELSALKQLGTWMSTHQEATREHVVGIGIHLTSPMLRGALSFVNTLAPSVVPQEVFKTRTEAEAWIVELLEGRGLSVPG